MINMKLDVCENCGKKSKDDIICKQCVRLHKITDDKACSKCDFYKEEICNISTEKVDTNHWCLFFTHREIV
ncbi:hypothetical protein LCGC14_1283810 [marine sediment metagenome]|uniref:Uncharacterized protein n=1 Tax=marine sediment metagenome TaxID=412755 RepID=A0A0F9NXJ7_9ZZZZ